MLVSCVCYLLSTVSAQDNVAVYLDYAAAASQGSLEDVGQTRLSAPLAAIQIEPRLVSSPPPDPIDLHVVGENPDSIDDSEDEEEEEGEEEEATDSQLLHGTSITSTTTETLPGPLYTPTVYNEPSLCSETVYTSTKTPKNTSKAPVATTKAIETGSKVTASTGKTTTTAAPTSETTAAAVTETSSCREKIFSDGTPLPLPRQPLYYHGPGTTAAQGPFPDLSGLIGSPGFTPGVSQQGVYAYPGAMSPAGQRPAHVPGQNLGPAYSNLNPLIPPGGQSTFNGLPFGGSAPGGPGGAIPFGQFPGQGSLYPGAYSYPGAPGPLVQGQQQQQATHPGLQGPPVLGVHPVPHGFGSRGPQEGSGVEEQNAAGSDELQVEPHVTPDLQENPELGTDGAPKKDANPGHDGNPDVHAPGSPFGLPQLPNPLAGLGLGGQGNPLAGLGLGGQGNPLAGLGLGGQGNPLAGLGLGGLGFGQNQQPSGNLPGAVGGYLPPVDQESELYVDHLPAHAPLEHAVDHASETSHPSIKESSEKGEIQLKNKQDTIGGFDSRVPPGMLYSTETTTNSQQTKNYGLNGDGYLTYDAMQGNWYVSVDGYEDEGLAASNGASARRSSLWMLLLSLV